VDRRDTARVVAHPPDQPTSTGGPTRHLHVANVSSVLAGRPHPTMHPSTVKRWLVLADVTAGLVGIGVAFAVQQLWRPVGVDVLRIQWLLLVAAVPFWFASAVVNHLHAARSNQRRLHEFKHIVGTAAMGVGSMIGLAFLLQQSEFGRGWAFTVFVAVVIAVTIERQIARSVFRRLRRTGRLSRPILVIGTDENAAALVHTVQQQPELGYRAVGFVASGTTQAELHGVPLVGDLAHVEDAAAEHGATGVLISLYSVDGPTVNMLSRRLTEAGLHVTLVSSLHDIDITRLRVQEIDNRALIYIEPTIRTGWRYIAMRIFDYTVALVGLLLTLPILVVSMVAIRLESKGPAIFRQVRTGVNGQHFEILKLRTMFEGADAMKAELMEHNESDGPLFKMRDDPRVTRVGRVLRKFSIDELPQFWNVVRGEMSVVGPRPALPSEVAQWEEDVHERLRVLPGITGIWQVSGRSEATFADYKRLDHFYIDNWSLAHDVRIVARTLGVVFSRRGAS
jgi:exopolysaccharide biosynthesis polyprenyl glycosylphosphotransferase